MISALNKSGMQVDAVVHGLFDTRHPLAPGRKTVADAWNVLPYENQIVTIELAREDLLALARDLAASRDLRNLMGVRVAASMGASGNQVDDLLANDGSPLVSKAAYRIALNSYDSQSGGERFPTMAKLVAWPSSHRTLHAIQIRDALIDFFVTRQKLSHASLLV